MPNPANGWDTNEQGDIIIFPLVAQYAATVYDMGCALRLCYSTNRNTPEVEDSAVQIVWTVQQATETIWALQQMIDQIATSPNRLN